MRLAKMLTEPQFKVLLILFDDKGHAGWQLAGDLKMADSNLNPYLKELEKRKFIFQGPPRISVKPKKREGDFKDRPFYLNKDLEILGTIIKEMVVTNRLYDTGFPFRIIEASNYIRLMKNIFKEDLNKCLAGFKHREYFDEAFSSELESSLEKKLIMHRVECPEDELDELAFFSDKEVMCPIKDKPVTAKSLKKLERWYETYLNKHQSSSSDNDRF